MTQATFALDRAANRLVVRRTLAAAPDRAFDAWTRPEQVSQWWDPNGLPLAECEVDLRVGGAFRFVNADGESHPFSGHYVEISRPRRLVFDAMGARGIVDFLRQGTGTRMTVTIQCASSEHLEHFVQIGVGEGTAQTLDNLVNYFAFRQKAHTA